MLFPVVPNINHAHLITFDHVSQQKSHSLLNIILPLNLYRTNVPTDPPPSYHKTVVLLPTNQQVFYQYIHLKNQILFLYIANTHPLWYVFLAIFWFTFYNIYLQLLPVATSQGIQQQLIKVDKQKLQQFAPVLSTHQHKSPNYSFIQNDNNSQHSKLFSSITSNNNI